MQPEVFAVFGGMFLFYLVYYGLLLAASICLGLAIYNDALSWGEQNAVMWGVLTGFVGWIPAVFYFVGPSRAKRVLVCSVCGGLLPPGVLYCLQCGQYHPEAHLLPPDTLLRSKKAKRFLIAWAVLNVSALVVLFVLVFILIFSMIPFSSSFGAIPYRY